MPFRDYVGTEFVPYLLPIIPRGAPLSPKTKQLTPEKIARSRAGDWMTAGSVFRIGRPPTHLMPC
jgi:hypothetical protein